MSNRQPADNETIFTIRVTAGRTQVHTRAGKHVFPQAALAMAVQALEHEAAALLRCPAHRFDAPEYRGDNPALYSGVK